MRKQETWKKKVTCCNKCNKCGAFACDGPLRSLWQLNKILRAVTEWNKNNFLMSATNIAIIKEQSDLKRNIWGLIPDTGCSRQLWIWQCKKALSAPFQNLTRETVDSSALCRHAPQSICLNTTVKYCYKIWACQTSPNLAPWNIVSSDVFTWRTGAEAERWSSTECNSPGEI